MKSSILVTNMECAACAQNIERKLSKTSGVSKVGVNMMTGRVIVDYDEKKVSEDKIKSIIKNLGFDTA